MIHAYIDLFREGGLYGVMECLLLKLYGDLKTKIPDLYTRIMDHAHARTQDEFIGSGSHGVLFFLKSLDIDLRLDAPLGTVCGYGRDDLMAGTVKDQKGPNGHFLP